MNLHELHNDLQPKQLSLFEKVEPNIDKAIEVAISSYIFGLESGELKVNPKDIKVLFEIKDYLSKVRKDDTSKDKIIYIGEPLL